MFKQRDDFFPSGDTWLGAAYGAIPDNAKFVLVAIFISHGISFGYNYLYKGEYASINPAKLMMQPYARVVVMHIAIIFGGFLTMTLGSPVGLLLMLVIIKTLIDVALHKRQHRTVQKKK